MLIIKILFWFFLFIILYSYILYGLIIWVYLKIRNVFYKKKIIDISNYEPEVTLIIATYNEEYIIRKKIENTLQLNYPSNKLKILFVTDGSSDNTNNIIQECSQVELLFKPERRGKVAAINRAMMFVKTPFVIFCDANTFLNPNCVKEIIKHYKDEKIGAVAGEKKVIDFYNPNSTPVSGEGFYWKYESILKKLDAEFYTVVGAAGELFSIRTELFEESNTNVILDDFIISMNICKKGYKVMYEPKAYAMEAPSLTMKEEQKRKIRISAGAFQSMYILKDLLNIFKYGKLTFQYVSHRVLRWSLCPAFLPVIFVINFFLYLKSNESIYNVLFLIQICFYLTAFTGWIFAQKNLKLKLFYIPYYFLFMNVSLYFGFIRYINNKQTVLWETAKRKYSSA